MVSIKTKTAKVTKKTKKVNKLSKTDKAENWQKVKIKGHVISDDFGGYEGLIGLEVLEDYDAELVKSSKKRASKQNDKKDKLKSKKNKVSKSEEEEEQASGSSSSESESEDEALFTAKSTRKARLAERHAQKLEKLKEKRQKRKETRKQKKENVDKEVESESDDNDNESNPSGQYVLLRPPPSEEENEAAESSSDDEEVPQLVPISTEYEDELSAWNGLGVPSNVLRALAEQGFKEPTQIQSMTLPAAIHGKKDILGAAETGSGKTLAFGIPMLAGIMELQQRNVSSGIRKAPKVKGAPVAAPADDEHELTPPPEELDHVSGASDEDSDAEELAQRKQTPLYGLVLTPTRELAVQVRNHLVSAAKYTGIKVAAIFGGLAVAKQERVLRQCPEIVVATPGRLWELFAQGNKHLNKLDDLSFLVIDETDRMVEKGHFEELRSLLKVLNADEQKKQQRQNFVFSATLTLVHDLPDHMQKRNVGKRPKFVKQTVDQKIESLIEELGISQPKIVDITSTQQTAQTLTESRLLCPIDQKDFYLYYFIQRHPGRTIVFCNSIDCVRRLATIFGLLDCSPLPLHANMIQKQRLKNLERFRDCPTGLLIATDVAARGLDIPNVEHVIHYQVPRTSENYVHRSGRTARANKHGITVMFMEPGEVRSYVKLYKTLERTEDLPLFPISERFLGGVRERVNLARDLDKEELKLKRVQSERGWMKKHAEEMDMIIDGYNDESGSDQDEDPFVIERRRNRLHVETVRAQLHSLLAQPLFPRGFSFKYPNSQAEDVTTSHTTSAVETMKAAIEDQKLAKKQRNKRKRNA